MLVRMHLCGLTLSLLGLSIVLSGCSHDHRRLSEIPKTTVIVMRHCVRSMVGNQYIFARHGYYSQNNYTSQDWPDFPVPAGHCLPRGEQRLKAQGRWLNRRGGLPLPVRAIADDLSDGQRDNVTMHRFLEGLDIGSSSVTAQVNRLPFSKADTSACKEAEPKRKEWLAAMEASLDKATLPAGYHKQMQRLYQAMGEGTAGNWTGIPCTAILPKGAIAYPVGACQAAATLTERLFMEWGGGMDIGWGRVTADDILGFLTLHTYHFFKWWTLPLTFRREGASMLREVSARLRAAEPGTTLLVGHDANMMMLNGALGLWWDAHPYTVNATLPGSMLRFDREGDTITASYTFVANYSNMDGEMLTVPARFGSSSSQISLQDFEQLAEKGSVGSCANSDVDPVQIFM